MPKPPPLLSKTSEKVFDELRVRKAMPLLEIAALTGIRGDDLENTVRSLKEQHLVTSRGDAPEEMIVSISGKYY